MKNIFLLPTDKPSKLFIDVDNSKLTITDKPIGGKHFMNQNLYIISDESVEDGDFYLYLKDNSVHKFIKKYHTKLQALKIQKKIILTTDQDLIKDGVQAIDDNFLEWFVKNPSCEKGEISNDQYTIFNSEWRNFYKIIIPTEEWISPMRPFKVKENRSETMQRFIDNDKTHSFCETPKEKCTMNYCDDNGCMNRKRDLVESKEILVKMMKDDEELGLYEEPNIIDKWLEENGNPEIANQVELEAENYVRNHPDFETEGFSEYLNGVFNGFIEGAKWKAESSYSEQEVFHILVKAMKDCKTNQLSFFDNGVSNPIYTNLNNWFNQFKKK